MRDLASPLALCARRLTTPVRAKPAGGTRGAARPSRLPMRAPSQHYCSDEALSPAATPSTSPIPIPTRRPGDWLARERSARRPSGWGRTWRLTAAGARKHGAPLVGTLSCTWHVGAGLVGGRALAAEPGLATRAGLLIGAFAFDRLHLAALTARHLPGNLASAG